MEFIYTTKDANSSRKWSIFSKYDHFWHSFVFLLKNSPIFFFVQNFVKFGKNILAIFLHRNIKFKQC